VLTGHGDSRFSGDDGSADPAAAAALGAYAAGTGSEHAALTALAGTRLLVPVVAVLADDSPGQAAGASGEAGPSGEKASEMALPKLIGSDGRPAIPAFTGVDALARWQASARPVPVDAGQVWRAAAEESCAVIVDVAGPVPLPVEGARLAALARGGTVPPLHEDPDVRNVVAAVVTRTARGVGWRPDEVRFRLGPAADDSDLLVEFRLPEAEGRAARAFTSLAGSSILEAIAPRARRGISISIAQRPAPSG